MNSFKSSLLVLIAVLCIYTSSLNLTNAINIKQKGFAVERNSNNQDQQMQTKERTKTGSQQKSQSDKVEKTQDDNDEGDEVVAFNKTIPIKKKLKEYAGDFDQTAFSELLTRKDLSHLLLSDIQDMMQMIANEFPDIVSLKSIGKTWEGRDISLLQLDARQMMQDKGINEDIVEILPLEKRQKAAQKESSDDDDDDSKGDKKKTDELSNEELLEKNEDINRAENKQAQAKTDAFNAIPKDVKEDAIAEQIGMDLIQVQSNLKAHRESEQLLQTGQMEEQIFDQNADEGDSMSISDMTNKAKEEIKPKQKEEKKQESESKQDGSNDDFVDSIVKDLDDAKKEQSSQNLAQDDKAQTENKESKPVEQKPAEKPADSKEQAKPLKEAKKEEEKPQKEEERPEKEAKKDDDKKDSKESKKEEVKKDQSSEKAAAAEKDIKIITPEELSKKPKLKETVKAKGKAGKEITIDPNDRAMLITGETHARELLSAQVPLFLCLKLLHQGVMHDREKYQKILRNQKFYFLPVLNVDGAAVVESHWLSEGKILNKRKNMNPKFQACGEENAGVDINRNFGIDWSSLNQKNKTELCGDFWPGESAFSEPESRALRDFVAQNRESLKFIINCHTSGNEFIWPYNGREPNDIETRSPGYLAMFQDIAKNAPFPDGVMKGNSYEVIGDKMGGDQDDFLMGTYGVPSVTSEMGFFGQYIQDWRCQSKGVCFEILRENTRWMEYIMQHIGKISQIVIPK